MKSASEHPARRLRALGLSPRKQWGQNFLVDLGVAARIAEAATTPPGGAVLEIGAGLGALTFPLAERARAVIAIERDAALASALAESMPPTASLRIVTADALRCDWQTLLAPLPRPHVLAGNLPYAITGGLVKRAIGLAPHVDGAVLMVQREVGERLCAAPGSRTYGALSVFVRAAYRVEELLRVRAGAFYPVPQVDSVVLQLRPLRPPLAAETEPFRQLVKAAFATRRKMLRNAWRGVGNWTPAELASHAEAAGIRLDQRAETLDVGDFAMMAERLERYGA